MGLVKGFAAAENADPRLPDVAGLYRAMASSAAAASPTSAAADEALRRPPAAAALEATGFSGGNQQKLVLAREMEHDPDMLLVGQPTRGVDIGAIEFIHQRLIAMRDAG